MRSFKRRIEVCLVFIDLEKTRDELDNEAFYQLLKIYKKEKGHYVESR